MKLESSLSRTLGHATDARLAQILAATLCGALIAAAALRHMLPPDAVLPVLVALLFGSAGVIGLAAIVSGRKTALLDVAGVLTFIGIITAALIEPDKMTRLVAPDNAG